MVVISGISRIGGKYRLRKRLLEYTPWHEFFLSMFCGACHYELNKPRVRYECFNDAESEIINYLFQIREHPKEFDEMKQGVFGLVSQEISNRICNGKIIPKNDLERAYFFYYLNKVTFGGSIWKVRKNPPYKGIDPSGNADKYKGKGYFGMINQGVLYGRIEHKDIENIKSKFRGITLPTSCKQDNFRGISPKVSYKGIEPKTTRPYTNNDCGLLSPINPEVIKRLRYVNLTTYDFRKVYKMFYEAFHVRKGLEKECFIYEDPPYPGTEKYYGKLFEKEFHQDLIDINLESPFNILQSIGGECGFYIDSYKDAGWNIIPVKTKYSTDANSQKESQEYFCMNYNIKKEAKLIMENQPNMLNFT